MKTISILLFSFILTNCIASDVIINVQAIQNLEPTYLDSIIVLNENNHTVLRIGNLPTNETSYEINLSKAEAVVLTEISDQVDASPFKVKQEGNNFVLYADLKKQTHLEFLVYTLDGRLLKRKSANGLSGLNTIPIRVPADNLYIVTAVAGNYKESFKINAGHIGSYDSVAFTAVQKVGYKSASASAFEYTEGDRLQIIVKKGDFISPDWRGKSENGTSVLLALPKSNRPFDMEQTLSSGAQIHTISFSGVAFYTGCYYASSFYPPGKVADYFGFQYMRDNDPDESGHNTDFLTKAAYHMLNLLNADQIQDLVDLAELQAPIIEDYALARLPLIKAFHRYLDGDIPEGTTQLSLDAVKEASHALYLIDGEISYGRAKYFSKVIKSLTEAQRDTLYKLGAVGMRTWTMPDKPTTKFPKDLNTLVMTNASEMFAWFLGTLESDVYICPERQGTYFGGFFMKDAPAMGNPDYSINTETTADKGAYMINSILDADQSKEIRGIYTTVTPSLNGMVEVREKIATEFRKLWEQDEIDKDSVMQWSGEYGELDGMYIFTMADQFVKVGRTLTSAQKDSLMVLRDLEDFPCKEGMVYLYSKEVEAPEIENTDKFFE